MCVCPHLVEVELHMIHMIIPYLSLVAQRERERKKQKNDWEPSVKLISNRHLKLT